MLVLNFSDLHFHIQAHDSCQNAEAQIASLTVANRPYSGQSVNPAALDVSQGVMTVVTHMSHVETKCIDLSPIDPVIDMTDIKINK